MRIALAPDLHCFYGTYDKQVNGESVRKKEWKNAAKTFLKTCKEERADVVVFPGDYFTNPKPSAENVLMVSSLFASFKKAGIEVVGIAGNHDISGIGKKSMNDVVSAIGGEKKWCYSTFDTMVVGNVGFAFLPYMKAPAITAYNPDFANMELSEHLIKNCAIMKAKLDEAKVSKTILVGHWSIQGAVTSSGKTMEHTVNGIETVLPLGDLVGQGWDACLFGHIHKPQVLSESKPFIAYSGCFQRINIGEALDDRGFYMYDTGTDQHQFFNLPAIEMKAFSKEIKTAECFDQLIKEISTTDFKGKIVYAKYTVSKDHFDWVNKREVLKALEKGKPLNIAGIAPKIIEEARQRDITLTEALDGETALRKWLGAKDTIDENQAGKVMQLFKKYSEELVENQETEQAEG